MDSIYHVQPVGPFVRFQEYCELKRRRVDDLYYLPGKMLPVLIHNWAYR